MASFYRGICTCVFSTCACFGCGKSPLPPVGFADVSRHSSSVSSSKKRSSEVAGDHAGPDDAGRLRALAERRVGWRASDADARTLEPIKVLGINDFHGQLSASRNIDGRPVGGAAVLAAYLRAAADSVGGRAVIVHAGDQVGASPPNSALLKDEPAITFMNLLGNDHCRAAPDWSHRCNLVGTVGNHEFDEGKAELFRLIFGGDRENGPFLSPYGGARFAYVSSNIVETKTAEPILPPFFIVELGPARLGFIGATTVETPTLVNPTGVSNLSFLDEADSINRYVPMLRNQGVEAIGVLLHQGGMQTRASENSDPGADLSGPVVDVVRRLDDAIDFVISGHTHRFTNALVMNEHQVPILVTQAFSAGTAFSEIELILDEKSGDVMEKSARIITTYADRAPGNEPDPAVQALVESTEELTSPLVSRIIGHARGAISRAETDAGESALGNLIADAQRAMTGADVALTNPGGIRSDLAAGEVTWGDLFNVQPFDNLLVTMDLTGQQILALLNQQWLGQKAPRMLKASGIKYIWDPSLPPEKNRIVSAEIGGARLLTTKTYRVVANSFLAAGGDNFVEFKKGVNRVVMGGDLDALVEFIEGTHAPISSEVEGRILKKLPAKTGP